MNAWRKWLAGLGLAAGMVCAGDVLAEQERLTVQLYCESPVIPYDASGGFEVDVPDRSATECRYDLEKVQDGPPQLIRQSGWTSNCRVSDRIDARDGPGVYRIRVASRDVRNPTDVLMKEKILVLLGKTHPDYWPSHTALQTQVWENYRHAFTTIRDTLASVKAKLQAGQSVDAEYAWFSSVAPLIVGLINPDDRGAPCGGNAYVDGGSGDPNTGAVGIGIEQPPASPNDWAALRIDVDLPDFLGLDPNGSTFKTIRWDDIPLN